jgi:hypothetical protein
VQLKAKVQFYAHLCDSIRFDPESDSNEIDESESHLEKHNEPRISIVRAISRSDKV